MIKFIRVPIDIWRMTDLQPGQRMLLALVVGFTASGNGCTMTNGALGEVLGCSARTVRRWLSDLEAQNLICITQQGGHRVAMGVVTAVAMEGGHSCGREGGHSRVHHIRKNKKDDIKHHNGKEEMRHPDVDEVTLYMLTLDRVNECRMPAPEVRRMASEAVTYYAANGWQIKDGTPIVRWRGVMASWAKRALKDYRPVQRRPKMNADEIRRAIAWHTKRRDNYSATDRQHLADSEQHSINQLQHAINELREGQA